MVVVNIENFASVNEWELSIFVELTSSSPPREFARASAVLRPTPIPWV